jgi:TolA-binding protein
MNDSFEQSLIASAKSDRMSPDRKRALVASVAGAATLSVATTAKAATAAKAATTAAAKKTATLAIVKWLAVGVTGTALVAGATKTAIVIHEESTRAEHAAHAPPPPTVSAPSARSIPSPTPVLASPPPSVDVGDLPADPSAVVAVVPPSPGVRTTAAKPAASPAARPISEELRLIDRARTALSSNDVAAADAALSQHAREFPGGTFAEEAKVLRIDALAKKGDRARAATAAKAYLASHPDSPYADRLRAYAEAP